VQIADPTAVPAGPRRMSNAKIAGASAVVAAAVFAAYWRLNTATIAVDEPIYTHAAWDYVHGRFVLNRDSPPMAKYLFGLGQLLFGRGIFGARVVAATFGIAVALFMFLLARAIVGRSARGFWIGILAAATWIALPRTFGFGVGAQKLHLDRFAMIDGVMVAFAMAALYTGWLWLQSRRWQTAVLTGVLLGLGTAVKAPVAILIPTIVVFALVRDRSKSTRVQALLLAASGAIAFLATYAPFGSKTFAAFRYMLHFQSDARSEGHITYVAGHVYHHAPIWALWWFQWVDNGPWVSCALLVGCAAALVLVHDTGVWYVFVAILATSALLASTSLALPHYAYAFLPEVLLLACIGFGALLRGNAILRSVGAVALGVICIAGAGGLWRIARTHPTDYARLPAIVTRSATPLVVVADAADGMIEHYVRGAVVLSDFPGRDVPVAALVLDPAATIRHGGKSFLADQARARGMHEVRVDFLEVWLPATSSP
jgi:4-amino-4-deoxy-L-arabinose transferase-like glycosyltransferase